MFLGTVESEPDLLTDMIKAAVCQHNFLMADKAYCPDDYGDSVLGETVQNGQLRQTVAQVGIPDATPASNHPANAAMALRDDIADNCLRKAPCPGS